MTDFQHVEDLHRHYMEVLARMDAHLRRVRAKTPVSQVDPQQPDRPVGAAERSEAAIERARSALARIQRSGTELYHASAPGVIDAVVRPSRGARPPGADVVAKRQEVSALHLQAADIAERVALAAETFASTLEMFPAQGDIERRRGLARVEREIAAVERRNAAKLRAGDIELEHLPSLPIRS